MPSLEVCLSPELLHLYDLEAKAVVVTDIFRATSCMVTAMGEGVDHILPVATVEECLALGKLGYIMAGERGGEKIEAFDLGNSPFHYLEEDFSGKKIAMTTTNGTLALTKAAEKAAVVWVGALLNLRAVAQLAKVRGADLLILCAGWKGRFSLEDTFFAGALIDLLQDSYTWDDDAALAAHRLYTAHREDALTFMQLSNHYQRLSKLGVHRDMPFCLSEDKYDFVPVFQEGRITIS
jgi:2-phosphosulfolactate phosphatase